MISTTSSVTQIVRVGWPRTFIVGRSATRDAIARRPSVKAVTDGSSEILPVNVPGTLSRATLFLAAGCAQSGSSGSGSGGTCRLEAVRRGSEPFARVPSSVVDDDVDLAAGRGERRLGRLLLDDRLVVVAIRRSDLGA